MPGKPALDWPALHRSLVDRHGDDARAAAWSSESSQHARFAVIAESVEPADSVLDVGCGLAHLAAYLRERGWRGTYLGVDVVPEMVSIATERGWPAVTGSAGSPRAPLSKQPALVGAGRFDVLVANGLASEQQGTERTRMAWLGRFVDDARVLASKRIVMTFLSRRRPVGQALSGYWVARLGKVVELAARLDVPVTVRHDYRADDFAVVIHLDKVVAVPRAP